MIQDLTNQISNLYEAMKKYTLMAGVKEETYNCILDVDPEDTEKDFQAKISFLEKVNKEQYAKVIEIQSLLPDEVWERYKHLNPIKLREEILLNNARKELKKVWNEYQKEKRKQEAIVPDSEQK